MTTSNRILVLDIETSHNIVAVFKTSSKPQVVTYKQILDERRIICASWKWYGQDRIYSVKVNSNLDDAPILERLSKVINSANIVIGKNHEAFDIPWINGRLMVQQLEPIPTVATQSYVDLEKLLRKHANFNSTALDYVVKLLGISDGKIKMELDDWIDIIRKRPGWRLKLTKMVEYNQKDVIDTEKLLDHIKPYVQLPFKLGMLLGGSVTSCPSCGSDSRHIKDYMTYKLMPSGNKYRRYVCLDCRHIYRGEKVQ